MISIEQLAQVLHDAKKDSVIAFFDGHATPTVPKDAVRRDFPVTPGKGTQPLTQDSIFISLSAPDLEETLRDFIERNREIIEEHTTHFDRNFGIRIDGIEEDGAAAIGLSDFGQWPKRHNTDQKASTKTPIDIPDFSDNQKTETDFEL